MEAAACTSNFEASPKHRSISLSTTKISCLLLHFRTSRRPFRTLGSSVERMRWPGFRVNLPNNDRNCRPAPDAAVADAEERLLLRPGSLAPRALLPSPPDDDEDGTTEGSLIVNMLNPSCPSAAAMAWAGWLRPPRPKGNHSVGGASQAFWESSFSAFASKSATAFAEIWWSASKYFDSQESPALLPTPMVLADVMALVPAASAPAQSTALGLSGNPKPWWCGWPPTVAAVESEASAPLPTASDSSAASSSVRLPDECGGMGGGGGAGGGGGGGALLLLLQEGGKGCPSTPRARGGCCHDVDGGGGGGPTFR
mmetsp:Transcript_144177/g.375466  ORF Transcript_144177/g.375466 Transcript_144177/m.375466 type:complete len:312 (-) Transcript_144177:544-1479(-)